MRGGSASPMAYLGEVEPPLWPLRVAKPPHDPEPPLKSKMRVAETTLMSLEPPLPPVWLGDGFGYPQGPNPNGLFGC